MHKNSTKPQNCAACGCAVARVCAPGHGCGNGGDRLQTPQFGHQDERGLLGTPRPAGRGRRGTGRAGLASEFTVQPLQPEQPPATLRAPVTKDQVSSTHPTAKVQAML